jgi:uncharacterized membrane protein YphA (DoxX/SURF4 family)
MKRFISRDFVTTLVESIGGITVVAGVFVLFGTGVALVAAGLALIFASFLASGGSK